MEVPCTQVPATGEVGCSFQVPLPHPLVFLEPMGVLQKVCGNTDSKDKCFLVQKCFERVCLVIS